MLQKNILSSSGKYNCALTMYCGLIFVLIANCMLMTSADNLSEEAMSMSKCSRYYYTETVSHPKKSCSPKVVLMSRCAGRCDGASSADPVVSFRTVVRHPFKYRCESCQDQLSIMKAVRLRCANEQRQYATYRYILSCGCEPCRSGLHLKSKSKIRMTAKKP
ncbi:norrin-like [Amphiura filiformis]|uniref:norrin-like n=1 Tax=Amphiura filiformis TaxID=82378 RepID=UPI003B224850